MRMSSWTPEVIRFMEDATAGTTYFSELAALVRPAMPAGGRVLDAGCGMGQLACELAGWAGRVDAVDNAPEAVAYLAGQVAARGLAKVRVVLDDMLAPQLVGPLAEGPGTLDADGYAYDLAVFCLSARFADALAAARLMRARRVLVVNKIQARIAADRDEAERRAGIPAHGCARARVGMPARNRRPRPLVDDFDECLARNRVVDPGCRGCVASLEYGQPFRSLEDAALYFRLFRTRAYPQGVTLAELDALLERRDDPTFPYYLPNVRHLAFFASDLAEGELATAGCAPAAREGTVPWRLLLAEA